jgi:hypothetical protein
MIVTKKHLPRRTVLRGLGTAVALPFLDAMTPAFGSVRAAAPVRRFSAIYHPLGTNMHIWTQRANGPLQINQILQPAEHLKDNLIVINGLDCKPSKSADNGQHPRSQAGWLTGARALKGEASVQVGVSVDQIIARRFEKDTEIGSIEMALEQENFAGSCGATGFSCAYENTLAWRTPTQPLPAERNPRAIFERLFGASDSTDARVRLALMQKDASILDSVKGQVSGLHKSVSASDRSRLDEYLDAVRDIERRLQKSEQKSARELPAVDMPVGVPESFEGYARIMFDLEVLAFQTDITRVVTYVLGKESSNRAYPEIGVPEAHHPVSHHGNQAIQLAKQAKIDAFHMKQFAYFVEKLRNTPDGDGTLLDSTLVLYGSGMSDSNLHINENVPTLLAAGKNLGMKGNRAILMPEGTPHANLHLTFLEKLGLGVEQFGNSDGVLAPLSV